MRIQCNANELLSGLRFINSYTRKTFSDLSNMVVVRVKGGTLSLYSVTDGVLSANIGCTADGDTEFLIDKKLFEDSINKFRERNNVEMEVDNKVVKVENSRSFIKVSTSNLYYDDWLFSKEDDSKLIAGFEINVGALIEFLEPLNGVKDSNRDIAKFFGIRVKDGKLYGYCTNTIVLVENEIDIGADDFSVYWHRYIYSVLKKLPSDLLLKVKVYEDKTLFDADTYWFTDTHTQMRIIDTDKWKDIADFHGSIEAIELIDAFKKLLPGFKVVNFRFSNDSVVLSSANEVASTELRIDGYGNIPEFEIDAVEISPLFSISSGRIELFANDDASVIRCCYLDRPEVWSAFATLSK